MHFWVGWWFLDGLRFLFFLLHYLLFLLLCLMLFLFYFVIFLVFLLLFLFLFRNRHLFHLGRILGLLWFSRYLLFFVGGCYLVDLPLGYILLQILLVRQLVLLLFPLLLLLFLLVILGLLRVLLLLGWCLYWCFGLSLSLFHTGFSHQFVQFGFRILLGWFRIFQGLPLDLLLFWLGLVLLLLFFVLLVRCIGPILFLLLACWCGLLLFLLLIDLIRCYLPILLFCLLWFVHILCLRLKRILLGLLLIWWLIWFFSYFFTSFLGYINLCTHSSCTNVYTSFLKVMVKPKNHQPEIGFKKDVE